MERENRGLAVMTAISVGQVLYYSWRFYSKKREFELEKEYAFLKRMSLKLSPAKHDSFDRRLEEAKGSMKKMKELEKFLLEEL